MKTRDLSSLPYRPCVGVMLLNDAGQVFVARRIDTPEAWQMPQGGIDKGEKPKQAAFRELKEEIGTDNATFLAKTKGWLTYDLPDDLVGKAFKGRYRGQKQKWFALRFQGDDSEINLDGHGHHAEFDAWQWVEMDRLPELIVPFKRDVYRRLVAEFGHLARAD